MINSSYRNLDDQSVLVVDDSMTVGILVSEVLTGCGAAETMTLTSQAALNLFLSSVLQKNLPDLQQVGAADFDTIFLDLIGKKSWEILNFLSQHDPDVLNRIILINSDGRWKTTTLGIHQTQLPVIDKLFLLNELSELKNAAYA